MNGNGTAGPPMVTAAEWFAGGQRIPYDPESAHVLTKEEAAKRPGSLRVFERADLVQALWRHHAVRRTVVVTFDYTSLALLELLRRQLDGTRETPAIAAALMVNGGLFADAHTHPWRTTPMLRTPLGALGMRRAQRSPRVFHATMLQAPLYSRGYHPTAAELAELRSAITRRDGAAFLHRAAGFTVEHRRHARRWDLAVGTPATASR